MNCSTKSRDCWLEHPTRWMSFKCNDPRFHKAFNGLYPSLANGRFYIHEFGKGLASSLFIKYLLNNYRVMAVSHLREKWVHQEYFQNLNQACMQIFFFLTLLYPVVRHSFVEWQPKCSQAGSTEWSVFDFGRFICLQLQRTKIWLIWIIPWI